MKALPQKMRFRTTSCSLGPGPVIRGGRPSEAEGWRECARCVPGKVLHAGTPSHCSQLFWSGSMLGSRHEVCDLRRDRGSEEGGNRRERSWHGIFPSSAIRMLAWLKEGTQHGRHPAEAKAKVFSCNGLYRSIRHARCAKVVWASKNCTRELARQGISYAASARQHEFSMIIT